MVKQSKKIKVELPNGLIIERVPKIITFGNFQQMIIQYNNEQYLIGDGDEYLRGFEEDKVYKLGRKLLSKSDIDKTNYNTKAWKMLPAFRATAFMHKVYLYDGLGIARELQDKHKEKIKEIEELGKKDKLRVIGVFEGEYVLGGSDIAKMTTYVYLSENEQPWVINDKVVGFMACVVNESLNIEETGSVGITEIYGLVKRVM